MAIHVTDVRSNPEDQIAHAAKILQKSEQARRLFRAIYRGKTKIKTISALVKATGLSDKRVLIVGAKLVGNRIIAVNDKKVEGRIAYVKDPFYNQHRQKILRLAENRISLKKYPTKYNVPFDSVRVVLDFQRQSIQVTSISVDDIDSFALVRTIHDAPKPVAISELAFKNGVKEILGEQGEFQDWGGEQNDLFTTRLFIGRRRLTAAFGFKGKGTSGILTPKKMGKNGDQIQRLFRSTATVFLVQYWGQVGQTIVEQMHSLATAKSAFGGRRIYYGIIDGADTQRLVSAYAVNFRNLT